MGSTGIGGLCVRKHVKLRQTRSGGTGVRSAYPYHLEEYPFRMEFGTPNLVGIASLVAGLDWMEESGGVEKIHAREMKLAGQLVDGFAQIDGVTTYCCKSMKNHLATIAMNVEGMDAENVGIMLDVDHNIATRTGLHCAPLVHEQIGTMPIHGAVRFAIGPFNTEEHIKKAVKSVAEIARMARTQAAVRE
jgi:selenocysteine lyase/cysteine desulfurase